MHPFRVYKHWWVHVKEAAPEAVRQWWADWGCVTLGWIN